MNLRALSLGLAGLLSLTACPGPSSGDGGTGGGTHGSGGGTGTGGGSGGSVPLDQLCTELGSNYCDYFVRCGAFESKANCLSVFGPQLSAGGSCAAPQMAGIDAGLIMYNGQAAAQCINSLTSAPCQGFNFGGADICNQVFVGTAPVGGMCGFQGECIPSAFCDTGGASCGGTCRLLVASGQPVGPGQQCVAGNQPWSGICEPEVQPGGNCAEPDGGFEFLPCVSPSSCYPDFLIDGGMRAICTQNATLGQVCNDFDAGIRGCGGFSFCDVTSNRCVVPGGVDAGCGSTGQFSCKLDLWCNTAASSPVCEPLSPLGGPCVSASSCSNGICDGGSNGMMPKLGACVALPGVNDPCSGYCATGLFCDFTSSTCQAKKADGQSCIDTNECVSNTCSMPADGGSGTCGPCH
jgi:hypothetical protein